MINEIIFMRCECVFVTQFPNGFSILAYVKISLARHYSDHGRHRDFDVSLLHPSHQSTSIAVRFFALIVHLSKESRVKVLVQNLQCRNRFDGALFIYWPKQRQIKTKIKSRRLITAHDHDIESSKIAFVSRCFFVTIVRKCKILIGDLLRVIRINAWHETGDDNDRN